MRIPALVVMVCDDAERGFTDIYNLAAESTWFSRLFSFLQPNI
jgi:hypothetical protein